MKRLYILIIVALVGMTGAKAQGCLPEGITFTTQAQVDSFPINYPGCSEIEGNLTIWGTWNITNLNGLNSITSVGGDLTINDSHSLPDFTGLDNLQTVGGNVLIKNNINQITYQGLENLTTIGGNFNTYQYYNTTITNFEGLNGLASVGGNFSVSIFNALQDFSGLENLVSIGGDFYVFAITAHSFSGLDNLTTIGGHLSVSGTPNLEDLTGLQSLASIGSYMNIFSIPLITSLNGLNNLTYVGGNIDIYSNDSLTSLYGIDNIAAETIDNLYIRGNHRLSTCEVKSVCDYLAAPTGTVYITDNAPGCNSQPEVEEACEFWGITENDNYRLVVHPNPTTGIFTIKTPGISSKSQLTILNLSGQKVLMKTNTEPKTMVDISSLPPGIYVVRLANDKTVETAKPIKQ